MFQTFITSQMVAGALAGGLAYKTFTNGVKALPAPRKDYTFYAWFYRFIFSELNTVGQALSKKLGLDPTDGTPLVQQSGVPDKTQTP